MTPRTLTMALAAALATTTTPALAADTPSTSAEPQDKATTLDTMHVVGRYLPDYVARESRTGTRTPTALIDVPQAVTVVTSGLMRDQAITGLAEVLRYVPGVGVAQGEGNRDTPVFRGNSSTADFFIDGVRDDVQYIRDVYNVERVEALKGPNAMVFGRGGGGGVLNRVTKQADGAEHRGTTLQFGSDGRRRATADFGSAMAAGALRINGVYEDSASFRDGVHVERRGINPVYGQEFGEATSLQLSYEHFRDERTADRGGPSYLGRPFDADPATFFGDPDQSPVRARVDALSAVVEHRFANGWSLRNSTRAADYAKSYHNVFVNGIDADASRVSLAAYGQTTDRRNLFNQTDLTWNGEAWGAHHTLLVGAEFGRQVTDNRRETGYFNDSADRLWVDADDPRSDVPLGWRAKATDADNHGVARIASFYLQDQMELSPRWQAIGGVRVERFAMDFRDHRDGQSLATRDTLVSPRLGLVYKPLAQLAFYASHAVSHQPRAGDQLASLNANNASLAPERYRNSEIGSKWDLTRDLSATLAVYRLQRSNVAVTDPADATRLLLVDGQTARGLEFGLAGNLTERWQVMGGYALQDGSYDSSPSASIAAGNRLAQLPRHSASLWNRFDFTPRFGAGLGLVHRGAIFANGDNAVTLPAFTRWDAALYYTVGPSTQLQLNIENLADTRYYASAHSNMNISPGAPRNATLSLHFGF